MLYSIEILSNKTLVYQSKASRLRHGALGKVVFECSLKTAIQILKENN